MTRKFLFALFGSVVASCSAGPSATDPGTVFVKSPTGTAAVDRLNVQAAFDAVLAGGTVQFETGAYVLGAGVRLTVPDVTVLASPKGTVLRGGEPERFDVPESELMPVVFGYTGILVQAPRQVIRGFSFEYCWHGIVVGPYATSADEMAAVMRGEIELQATRTDGQLIEGNSFRRCPNGLRMLGVGSQRSVVRDNEFVDVFHAIGMYGAPVDFVDNRVTVDEPEKIPTSKCPGAVIILGATDGDGRHVVQNNVVSGYPDAIYVVAGDSEVCRDVKILDNEIRVARVALPPDSLYGQAPGAAQGMAGSPITLCVDKRGVTESGALGVLEGALVRGNKIFGAEGLGIRVEGACRSRIEGNTITGIRKREPFPGLSWDGDPGAWKVANGAGIWLSSDSHDNEILGNRFDAIASDAIVIEGNGNRVELAAGTDTVRDLGQNNDL